MQSRQRGPDLEAEVYLLTEAEGGRRTPITSGYRPDHNFERDEPVALNCAIHEYPNGDLFNPGETARALLWLLAPDLNASRLYEGMKFTAQEGSRIVARCRIIRVLNPELRRS